MALDRRQVTAHRLASDLLTIGASQRHRVKVSAARRAFAVLLGGLSAATSNPAMHSFAVDILSANSRKTSARMRRAWLDLLGFVAQRTDSAIDEECAAIPNVMLFAMVESIRRHCKDITDDAMTGVFNAWINRHVSWLNRRATNDGLFAAAVIAPLVGRNHAVLELGAASGDLVPVLRELRSGRRNPFIFEARRSAWFGMIRALAHGYEVIASAGGSERGVGVTCLDLRKERQRLTPQHAFRIVSRGAAASRRGLFCLILSPSQAQFVSDIDETRAFAERSLRAVISIPGTKGHLVYIFALHAVAQTPGAVLLIDGSAIGRLVEREPSVEDAFATGMFVGNYLMEVLDAPGLGYEPIMRAKFMHGILGDLLGGDFRELEGICRVVPIDRLVSIRAGDISPLLKGSFAERLVDARVKTLLGVAGQRAGSTCQYVIGNNGVGKSLLLKAVADELVRENRDTLALAFTSPDRFAKLVSDHYRYRGLQAGIAGEGMMTLDDRLFTTAVSIHRSPERSAVFYEMLRLLGFRAECVAMAVADNEGESTDVASTVVNLAEAAKHGLGRLELKSLDGMTLGLSRSRDDQLIVPYAELSSGERQIVRLAVALAGEVRPGTVVLVDEPEVSLHVAWQTLLPRVFACLQAAMACHIVVATHSPLVISTVGEEATCYSLSSEGMNEIPSEELRSVESALFDGFSTYTPRNRAVHEECAHLVAEAIRLTSETANGRLVEFVGEAVDRLGVAETTVQRGASTSPESASKDVALIARTVAALREIAALDAEYELPA